MENETVMLLSLRAASVADVIEVIGKGRNFCEGKMRQRAKEQKYHRVDGGHLVDSRVSLFLARSHSRDANATMMGPMQVREACRSHWPKPLLRPGISLYGRRLGGRSEYADPPLEAHLSERLLC